MTSRHAVVVNEEGLLMTDGVVIKIGDVEVDILRLSMTGNLGYELHGPMDKFNEVYAKVLESGQKFGAKQLGLETYNFLIILKLGFLISIYTILYRGLKQVKK